MRTSTFVTLAAALALAGCGGGSQLAGTLPGGGGNPGGGGGGSATSDVAVSSFNALGTPVKSVSDDSNTLAPKAGSGGQNSFVPTNGCDAGVELLAPDRNGDPNSTEAEYFYDTACTQLAHDAVRIFKATGSGSESIGTTTKMYAKGNGSVIAQRSDAATIENATFDQYGFPLPASGFERQRTGTLDISGVKSVDSAGEFVMLPSSGSTNTVCSDTAGFNATGIPALDETFGWAGGDLPGGTRVANSSGSVTWAGTHSGTVYKASIGGLAIVTGTPNGTCPIETPMFTLNGGTALGGYTIPLSVTFDALGELTNLTVTNAQLASGATLNVVTNASIPPATVGFVSGTIARDGKQIATFQTDAFGDGTLTVTATGRQFVVTDWHVIR